jgi:hypothetical protein
MKKLVQQRVKTPKIKHQSNSFDFSAMCGLLNLSYYVFSTIISIVRVVSAVFIDNHAVLIGNINIKQLNNIK